MAQGSALYRIEADVSDIDAGAYRTVSLRIAQHPSEDMPRVVVRALAYCLAFEEGIGFGRGLDEPDEPALSVTDGTGRIVHWIDVGHPSAERLHRASKSCPRITIVCHKSPDGLVRERERKRIHGAERVAVWLLSQEIVAQLGEAMDRVTAWTVVLTGESLLVNVGDQSFAGTLVQTTLDAL